MRFRGEELTGYWAQAAGDKLPLSEGDLEMLKVAFCTVLASWMAGCLMAIVYSREIAEFIVERMQ